MYTWLMNLYMLLLLTEARMTDTRTKDVVLSDIKKLNKLMEMLPDIGSGYTMNQRIKHHRQMADDLEAFQKLGGSVDDILLMLSS